MSWTDANDIPDCQATKQGRARAVRFLWWSRCVTQEPGVQSTLIRALTFSTSKTWHRWPWQCGWSCSSYGKVCTPKGHDWQRTWRSHTPLIHWELPMTRSTGFHEGWMMKLWWSSHFVREDVWEGKEKTQMMEKENSRKKKVCEVLNWASNLSSSFQWAARPPGSPFASHVYVYQLCIFVYLCCNYLLQIALLLQYCTPIFNGMEEIMTLPPPKTASIFKGSWSLRDAFALEFWLQGQYHLEELAHFPKPISWRDTKNNKGMKGMIQNILPSSWS